MKAAFYREDYQKLLKCLLIKRLGQAFISKHASKSLKSSAELLKHSAEVLRFSEKTKSSPQSATILKQKLGKKCFAILRINY